MSLPLLGAGKGTPGAAASPLLTGLVSYWKLDEAGGQRNDSHGTNHLTDNNTVTQAAGKIGDAAQFTGANSEYLSVADNASLVWTSAFSASFWIYRDSLSLDVAYISKWNYPTVPEWVIQSAAAGGSNTSDDMSIYLATSGVDNGTGCRMDFNNANQSATTWYHIVVIYDGSLTGDANRLKVYQNGVQLTLTVGSGAVPASLQNSAAELRLGDFQGLNRYFTGRIDELGLWTRALTALEVAELYGGGAGKAYPF